MLAQDRLDVVHVLVLHGRLGLARRPLRGLPAAARLGVAASDVRAPAGRPTPRARIAAVTTNSTSETPASTMPAQTTGLNTSRAAQLAIDVADLPDQPQGPGQPGGRGQQRPGHRRAARRRRRGAARAAR